MSIDTLLEAARYLEWQAQQQQITRVEEEQRKDKELISREVESLSRVEVVTSLLAQPIRANHVSWGDDSRWHQHHPSSPAPPPPPASLPPAQVPVTIIPMVPVVTATPSVPPLPLAMPIAATATMLNGSLPVKTGSPPPSQQQAFPCHLLCTTQIKVEVDSPPVSGSPSQLQSQVHIPYPISTPPCQHSTQHALLAQQAVPTSQPRPNGMAVDDRGLDGRRRPGGAGTREVHNKLEKNRRAHLKECFETLKKNVPNVDEKKTSNLSVLRSALRYIQTLKRKEKEYEHDMERLAREKIATQQRLAELVSELSQCMDLVEINRVLRQTVQPEDDQASTSTASEGEDNLDQDIDEDMSPPPSLPKATPPILQVHPLLAPHLSIHTALPIAGLLTTSSPSGPLAPQTIAPAPILPPVAQVQPTVIAHAAVSHPSVIQAVNHALPANHKHLTHIAPSPGPTSCTPQPMAVAPVTHQPITAQPIGHITVHPVAHLGGPLPSHLPALYPQGVSVSQPTVVGHITHTFTHHTLPHVQANANGVQVNGAAMVGQGSPSLLGKPTAVLAPHPQLVGQTTVLNPVTMVTVPPFPVSTLKLA